jgi:hypothetical protein
MTTGATVTRRADMELIYSPDDHGYYWQRFTDWATSQVFGTWQQANKARRLGQLKFS